MTRAASVCAIVLLSSLGCATRAATGPEPAGASTPGAIAEREGAAIDQDDPCAPYLSDAPAPASGEFMPVSDEEIEAAAAIVNDRSEPRCAHYFMVHRTLAAQALEDPRVSQLLWTDDSPGDFLDVVATSVNEACVEHANADWLLPMGSFRVGRTEILGRPLVVVDVIPTPVATTEAHMFALVGYPWAAGEEHQRWTGLDQYYVLEHSVTREPTHTVMGGWTIHEGSLTHLNMGDGPEPTPAAFVHVIGQNLCADFVRARTRVE